MEDSDIKQITKDLKDFLEELKRVNPEQGAILDAILERVKKALDEYIDDDEMRKLYSKPWD